MAVALYYSFLTDKLDCLVTWTQQYVVLHFIRRKTFRKEEGFIRRVAEGSHLQICPEWLEADHCHLLPENNCNCIVVDITPV